MSLNEHQIQANVLKVWPYYAKKYQIPQSLLFAIPNGGARNVVTGKLLKEEGVRAGIPDLFLAISRCVFHGMFIEMKTSQGKVSKMQNLIMEILREQNYLCIVCRSESQALDAIDNYLSNKREFFTRNKSMEF